MGTYTFQQALTAVSIGALERQIEAAAGALACNMALNKIWTAFSWRESVGALPPFYLVPLTQEYGPPTVSVPSDFLGLETAYYQDRQGMGDSPYIKELKCIADISDADYCGEPKVIGYDPTTLSFKIHPLPPSSWGAPWHVITGHYKKLPTFSLVSGGTANKVTTANISNALLPFKDVYFDVWIEVLKWAVWAISSNPRAGQVQMQNGVKSYTGQLGAAMAAIDYMADNERGELGPLQAGPRESLMDWTY